MMKLLFILLALFTGIHSFSFAAAPSAGKPVPAVSKDKKDEASPFEKKAIDEKRVAVKEDALELILSTPDFSTFVHALRASGQEKLLQDKGPITVFVPNNDAFAALPAGELDKFFREQEKEHLVHMIAYHVVSGIYDFEHVPEDPTGVATKSGKTLALHKSALGIVADDGNVVKADIPASNGYIHIIDRVLLPE